MTKNKWTYVASGHYSTPETGGWTVHVLRNGAVYKTHPSHTTTDISGSKADKYIESAQTKFPVRGKRRVEPEREPDVKKETPMKEPKPTKTPRKKVTKKRITAAAKKFAKGTGAIIGTTRAFVTEIGEAEERTYAKRKAPPPTKKATKKKTPARRTVPHSVTEHPLEYLMSGEGAMPQTRRKAAPKRRREQTLEEYLGF